MFQKEEIFDVRGFQRSRPLIRDTSLQTGELLVLRKRLGITHTPELPRLVFVSTPRSFAIGQDQTLS